MKLNKNFISHDVGGEHLLVPTGKAQFKGLLKSNETASFIIRELQKDTTADKIADALCAEYDVSREKALADVGEVLGHLKAIGALDD